MVFGYGTGNAARSKVIAFHISGLIVLNNNERGALAHVALNMYKRLYVEYIVHMKTSGEFAENTDMP